LKRIAKLFKKKKTIGGSRNLLTTWIVNQKLLQNTEICNASYSFVRINHDTNHQCNQAGLCNYWIWRLHSKPCYPFPMIFHNELVVCYYEVPVHWSDFYFVKTCWEFWQLYNTSHLGTWHIYISLPTNISLPHILLGNCMSINDKIRTMRDISVHSLD
jgi:hypothetical protein